MKTGHINLENNKVLDLYEQLKINRFNPSSITYPWDSLDISLQEVVSVGRASMKLRIITPTILDSKLDTALINIFNTLSTQDLIYADKLALCFLAYVKFVTMTNKWERKINLRIASLCSFSCQNVPLFMNI